MAYNTYQGYGAYEEPEYHGNYDYEYNAEKIQRQREQDKLAYEIMLISNVVKINPRLTEYDRMLLGLRR